MEEIGVTWVQTLGSPEDVYYLLLILQTDYSHHLDQFDLFDK